MMLLLLLAVILLPLLTVEVLAHGSRSGSWCGCGAVLAGAVGPAGEAEQRREGGLGRPRLGRPGSAVAAGRMQARAATCGCSWRHRCGRSTAAPAGACSATTVLRFFSSLTC